MGFTFFGQLDKALLNIKEVPWAMRFSMMALAIICVVAGLLLIPLFKPFLQSAVDVLLSGNGYKDAVFGAIR
jgi:formate hydrogenlyase subunit 3/multisubunit Na+/H+ antiporter MnhD subunit